MDDPQCRRRTKTFRESESLGLPHVFASSNVLSLPVFPTGSTEMDKKLRWAQPTSPNINNLPTCSQSKKPWVIANISIPTSGVVVVAWCQIMNDPSGKDQTMTRPSVYCPNHMSSTSHKRWKPKSQRESAYFKTMMGKGLRSQTQVIISQCSAKAHKELYSGATHRKRHW